MVYPFRRTPIENLSTSPAWRSSHIEPADVTSLRRRWTKAVIRIMQRHAKEVERLHRFARRRPEWAFRHNAPGFCPICQDEIASALDVHMMISHLELGQLWRCLVEWCAVWKGSVSDCLGHLHDKHGGSEYFALKNMAKFPPTWMVTRDVWQTTLSPDVSGIAVDARLFNEAGCRLVHKYRAYKDPFPHPALREGVLPRLLSFVSRTMAIVQLTQLHISIPRRGRPRARYQSNVFRWYVFTGTVEPPSCIVSHDVTVLSDAPPLVHSPDIFCMSRFVLRSVKRTIWILGGATMDTPNPIISPPPGFQQFSLPWEDWAVGGDPLLFNFAKELPGWFPWSLGGLSVDLPPLPVSPILPDSLDDSVTANMGSSREESNTPSEIVVVAPSVGDVIPDVTDAAARADSPLATEGGQLAGSD